MVAGIVMELAEVLNPPTPAVFPRGVFTKSNLNAWSERMAILSTSVGTCKSFVLSWTSSCAVTVEKAIAERMRNGEIIVEEKGGESGGERANDYIISRSKRADAASAILGGQLGLAGFIS